MINNKHKKLLLPYQIKNTENIIKIIEKNESVLDASDTGTGKTYSAVCACATLKLKPIVICPKAVMKNWKTVCKIFNVEPFFIVNYETLKYAKYYNSHGDRVKCPYIKYVETKDKNDKDTTIKKYVWIHIPKNVIFIYDEAHKCANTHTYNGLILRASKETTNNKIMLLSATIADNEKKFKLFFYILNFIEKKQMIENGTTAKQCMQLGSIWVNNSINPMKRIHEELYPNRATRMSIDTLGKLFPETQITATPYSMGKTAEAKIEYEYLLINEALQELKNKKGSDKSSILVKILRSHQRIELLKIPTFAELAVNFMHDGLSVVIFVNFTQTLKTIAEILKTNCLIHGSQTDNERQNNINDFQSNKKHVIISNIKAGGVGISLHDVHHKRRRVSLISPCWSSIDFVQVLGRVHRAGGSKSLQRIIYCSTGIEEKLAKKLQKKLLNIQNINNGDLDLSNIKFDKKIKQVTV